LNSISQIIFLVRRFRSWAEWPYFTFRSLLEFPARHFLWTLLHTGLYLRNLARS